METARIDIAYRPVRVAWVIESTDFESFRKVVRLSHTLWGGRFNPIVFADKPKQARELVDSFRVDMLMPVGASPDVARLAAAYPHLPTPYFSDGLFRGRGDDAHALLLDIENGLVFAREKQKTTDLIKAEFRTFMWDPADPLADMLLVQLGSYPSPQDFPIDYWEIFSTLNPTEDVIPVDEPLPSRIYDHPGIAYLPRYNLQRHFSIQSKPDLPGFFVGDVTSLDDLVAFWNLRAADNTLQFIDRAAFDRFEHLIPDFERRLLAGLAHPDQDRGHIAVWARREILDEAGQRFSGRRIILVAVDEHSWNGLNMRPPMMILGTASALGVVGDSSGRPRVSFALADKPFSGDIWFHTQHLVASLSLIGVGLLDQRYTFQPPYVPELNLSFGRSMHFQYERMRVEPERLGLVIDAADNDAFINGISPEELFVELFKRAGVSAKPSPAGLLARQLIAELGGVDGGRVFKIPGVRRLIKQRGPTDSFTHKVALQTIGTAEPDRPNASFKDHEGLFIEPRTDSILTPPMVFAYLVEKGLFRMGADLVCPTCSLKGWVPLDSLRTKVACESCGTEFNSTRQLIAGTWHYRRSGLLGRERNVHGAIPVVLTLQQLYVNLRAVMGRTLYLPSYELEGMPGTEFKPCEVDFLFLVQEQHKPDLIIGECKDRGDVIDATDAANMKRVGALFPEARFEVYYLFSKLGEFSLEEIALAARLNEKYHNRVILLTSDELEPYHIYDRATDKMAKESYAGTAQQLASVTAHLYFSSG